MSHEPLGSKARNHLVCQLLDEDANLRPPEALRLANKIMRQRRKKNRRKQRSDGPGNDPIGPRTLVWFGKFKGKPVQDVPAAYWLWFMGKTGWTPRVNELKDFLVRHLFNAA